MHFVTIVFMVCLVSMAQSQRSPYISGPVRYPDVAYRFRKPEEQQPAVAQGVDVGNRNNVPTEPTTTIRLPIDALGNVDVVNQINQWPEERRPFWYVNAEAIEKSRSQQVPAPGANPPALNVQSRSSFLPART